MSKRLVNRRHLTGWLLAAASTPWPARAKSRVLEVGPGRDLKQPSDAARLARDGDTVAVDAGDYTGDVAVWRQDRLTLRASGGRVRLRAAGAAAERKGIWVIKGGTVLAEGFDFSGARVVDRNGAGIRFETGALTVRQCRFIDNEMGLLSNHDPQARLVVDSCEFAHNRRPDGHNHNLYVGRIAHLIVTGSYFHHGHIGHLLKSRAAVNHIFYNRLTDDGGQASYELEFPNGGVAVVVGNLIGQSAGTQNRRMVAWGAEGLHWPENALVMAHNTLVNQHPGSGEFIKLFRTPGVTRLVNNLFVGPGVLRLPDEVEARNNPHLDLDTVPGHAWGDFRVRRDLAGAVHAVAAEPFGVLALQVQRQYRHPAGSEPLSAPPAWAGAVQSLVD